MMNHRSLPALGSRVRLRTIPWVGCEGIVVEHLRGGLLSVPVAAVVRLDEGGHRVVVVDRTEWKATPATEETER